MRIKDSNPEERKSSVRGEGLRNYYLAFEGRTEYLYFKGIKENRSLLKIPQKIDLQLMDRYDQEAGQTKASSIIEGMLEYKHALKTGEFKVKLFVNTIVQQVYDFFKGDDMGHEERENFKSALYSLQDNVVKNIIFDTSVCDGTIITSEEKAFRLCEDSIISKYPPIKGYLSQPNSLKLDTFDESMDVFCLIMDRDRSPSRDERYYSKIIERCKDKINPIELYITNSAFEFWLILHFDNSRKLSPEIKQKILANKKITKKIKGKDITRNYAEWYLQDTLRAEYKMRYFNIYYSKTRIFFDEYYRDNIDAAIVNCNDCYTTNIDKLENSLGSNLGILINKIRKNQK